MGKLRPLRIALSATSSSEWKRKGGHNWSQSVFTPTLLSCHPLPFKNKYQKGNYIPRLATPGSFIFLRCLGQWRYLGFRMNSLGVDPTCGNSSSKFTDRLTSTAPSQGSSSDHYKASKSGWYRGLQSGKWAKEKQRPRIISQVASTQLGQNIHPQDTPVRG